MSDAAILADSRQIVVDKVFPHTLDVVWKTLTTQEMMARWLRMEPKGFRAAVGTSFTYQTAPAGAWDGVIHCEVLEVEPLKRLAYAWKGGHDENIGYGSRLDTVVTFLLSAVENGTRIRLVHSGFVLPRNESAFEKMSAGWTQVVSAIAAIAAETG